MDVAYWVASTPSFATHLRRMVWDLRTEPKPQVRASQALSKRRLAGGFSQRSEIVEKLLAHGAVRLAASRTRVRWLSEKPVPRRGFLVEIRPNDLLESQALIQGIRGIGRAAQVRKAVSEEPGGEAAYGGLATGLF
jgi:hypothetical protein